MSLRVGIDIGSTTVKVVVLDEHNKLLFRSYERHYSKTRERACQTLRSISEMLAGQQIRVTITGSAGLGVANAAGIDFVQEVYATAAAVNTYIPDTDAVIELGGEDAKIIFFGGALEERMNGSCAGGTGAFIDQMATLMNVSVQELDALSLKHEKIYPIASRCGVFAKSDIQPILNQGGRKEDVAASIFQAVVDRLSGRSPPLSYGSAGALCGHPEAGRRPRYLPQGRRLLRRHGCSPVRRRLCHRSLRGCAEKAGGERGDHHGSGHHAPPVQRSGGV